MKFAQLLFLFLWVLTPFAGPTTWASATVATPATAPVRSNALSQLSSYEIAATLDLNGSISATERLHYVNSTGSALPDIAFRLYPNALYYGAGGLSVHSVTLNGQAVVPTYQVDDTAMLVAFPELLNQGASAELTIVFTTVVPLDATASYGIFTRHVDTGDWIVCDWNPIVAGHDATGWRLDPPGVGGDPTFSDAAFYTATITAPSDLTVIASGGELRNPGTGTTSTWSVERTPLREFTFIASPTLKRFDRAAGDHVVSVYLHPAGNQTAIANLVLDGAAEALQTYEPLFGAYAYPQLDIIDVPLPGALGVSWTGLLFVNGGLLFPTAAADPARLQFTLAHEISHQWWGALVGSNTNDHAFLAEGMANCSAVLFFLQNNGLDAASTQLTAQIARPYLSALNSVGDGVVDRPSSANASGPSLGILIYGKAALGFLAIREAIGVQAFAAALTAYVADFSWRVSQPGDLRAEFQSQTNQDIGPLWNFWFESTTVTPANVQTVVDRLS